MLDSDSDFRILRALHNFSEGKKRRKKVTRGSRFYTSMSLRVVLSLSTLYFKTVDWSLSTQIKHWERNGVLGWGGVCGWGGGGGSGNKYELPKKRLCGWLLHRRLGRKNPSTPSRSRNNNLLVTSPDTLPLSCKRLVEAKAANIGSSNKQLAYCWVWAGPLGNLCCCYGDCH